MTITITSGRLANKRWSEVQRLMRVVADGSPQVTSLNDGLSRVVAVYSGAFRSGHFRDWRFPTAATGILASYHESWNPSDSANDFELGKSYFNLWLPTSETTQEVLALHVEPTESESVYRKPPHLHMSTSRSPLDKAHLCVELGLRAEVMAGIDELTGSLQRVLEMIAAEILPRCSGVRFPTESP